MEATTLRRSCTRAPVTVTMGIAVVLALWTAGVLPVMAASKGHLRLVGPADFRHVPWLGSQAAAFTDRFGPPHRDARNSLSWFYCPNGGVYQLSVFFNRGNGPAWEIVRNYCTTIPSAAAQLKEAHAFFPPDARRLSVPTPDPQTWFYRSAELARDLSHPVWLWGGAPGTFEVQTDDQGGQWTLTPGQ